MKIWPSSAVTLLFGVQPSLQYQQHQCKATDMEKFDQWTFIFLQLCVGLGKIVREALPHVLPKSKTIYFEFQMHVPPEGDAPLQYGGMPAISFGTSCVHAQATSGYQELRVYFWLCRWHSPCAWMSNSTPLSLSFSVKRGLASLKNALKLIHKWPIDNNSKGDC